MCIDAVNAAPITKDSLPIAEYAISAPNQHAVDEAAALDSTANAKHVEAPAVDRVLNGSKVYAGTDPSAVKLIASFLRKAALSPIVLSPYNDPHAKRILLDIKHGNSRWQSLVCHIRTTD